MGGVVPERGAEECLGEVEGRILRGGPWGSGSGGGSSPGTAFFGEGEIVDGFQEVISLDLRCRIDRHPGRRWHGFIPVEEVDAGLKIEPGFWFRTRFLSDVRPGDFRTDQRIARHGIRGCSGGRRIRLATVACEVDPLKKPSVRPEINPSR